MLRMICFACTVTVICAPAAGGPTICRTLHRRASHCRARNL